MADFIRLSFEKAVNAGHISRLEIKSHDPLTVRIFILGESLTLEGEEAENLLDGIDSLVINRDSVGSEYDQALAQRTEGGS